MSAITHALIVIGIVNVVAGALLLALVVASAILRRRPQVEVAVEPRDVDELADEMGIDPDDLRRRIAEACERAERAWLAAEVEGIAAATDAEYGQDLDIPGWLDEYQREQGGDAS